MYPEDYIIPGFDCDSDDDITSLDNYLAMDLLDDEDESDNYYFDDDFSKESEDD
ncbi:MAG: hypothetical protein RSE07_03805 [Oscillospiraceae bacterium]